MQLQKKSFEFADEVRPTADRGRVEIVKIDDRVVGKGKFEPGWRWSEHVKPIAGTDSCQAAHFLYVLSGRQKIVMDDGSELEIGPGDVVSIPPGHDGWVVGDEPCVVLDFKGAIGSFRRLVRQDTSSLTVAVGRLLEPRRKTGATRDGGRPRTAAVGPD